MNVLFVKKFTLSSHYQTLKHVYSDIEDPGSETVAHDAVQSDILPLSPARPRRTKIPNMKDFLVAYSTVQGGCLTILAVVKTGTNHKRTRKQ